MFTFRHTGFFVRWLIVTGVLGLGSAAKAASAERHVVLISIDGFPASLWRRADVPTPNLKRLAEAGAAADAMTVANPSLTWPNHTTLITGVTPRRHGVLYNGLFVRHGDGQRPTINPRASKAELVRWPTLYDRAHAAGLSTAESNWVAIRHAATITWSFPEFPEESDPVVREMRAAGVLTAEERKGMEYGQPTNLPWHDEIWLRGATFIWEQHRPNLLLYHILTTDSTHHNYGPGNVASFAALAYADRLVGELVRTVEQSGLKASTTFIVTTDHGFNKVSHLAFPNVVLKRAGLIDVAGEKILRSDAYVKGQGGLAMVYITDPTRRAELLPVLKNLFARAEGVGEVIDGEDGPTLGMPTPTESEAMADLVLYPRYGYAFREGVTGDDATTVAANYCGTHGGKASDPELDGIFIASGRGIKRGVKLDRIRNLDVAPTAARLLGVDLPEVEGRVLDEILSDAAGAR